VWPEAVGDIACSVDGAATDYFVRALRLNNRDELVVSVVSERDPEEFAAIGAQIERLLQQRLGLKIAATVVGPGELDALTEFHTSPKPKRFRDERQQTAS
jgi:phenylacetate-coenzyme A ligase PaaK-like adenylate-forming protein